MKTLLHVLFLSMLLSLAAVPAHAAGVMLLQPVAIDPDSKMPEAVREQCRLDYELQNDILKVMQHYDRNATTTSDANKGQVLKVTITYVLGVGGGSFTGPKAIGVKAEYLRDGKTEYVVKMHRRSSLFGMSGTCHLLDGAAKGLAKRLAKWAQGPKTDLKDEDDTDASADTGGETRPGVVNGIDPNAEAPVAAPATSAAH